MRKYGSSEEFQHHFSIISKLSQRNEPKTTCRGEVYVKTKEMVWTAFDVTRTRRYMVESNVPNSVIDIRATLEPPINNNKDQYAFIECCLFLDVLVGPGYFETY